MSCTVLEKKWIGPPVQTTRGIHSFWKTTFKQIRIVKWIYFIHLIFTVFYQEVICVCQLFPAVMEHLKQLKGKDWFSFEGLFSPCLFGLIWALEWLRTQFTVKEIAYFLGTRKQAQGCEVGERGDKLQPTSQCLLWGRSTPGIEPSNGHPPWWTSQVLGGCLLMLWVNTMAKSNLGRREVLREA